MDADGTRQRELTLPRLGGIAYGTIPALVTAGKPVTVVYDVQEESGADIGIPTVKCNAKAGARSLRLTKIRFTIRTGRAACTWTVPRRARGKRLIGQIAVTTPTGTITQRFNFAVR